MMGKLKPKGPKGYEPFAVLKLQRTMLFNINSAYERFVGQTPKGFDGTVNATTMGTQPTWGPIVCVSMATISKPSHTHLRTTLKLLPRAFCTGGLDPGGPLLRSERKQGLSADPFCIRISCQSMLGALKTVRKQRITTFH